MKNNNWRRNRRNHHQQNKNNVNPLRNQFDSNGPTGRLKGNAQQLCDRYQNLARETNSDDRILQESYWQYAEHYQRLLNEFNERDGEERYNSESQYDDATPNDEEGVADSGDYTPAYSRNNRNNYDGTDSTEKAEPANYRDGRDHNESRGEGRGDSRGEGRDDGRTNHRGHRQYPPRVSRPNRFDKMARTYDNDYRYSKPVAENTHGEYNNSGYNRSAPVEDADDDGQLPGFIRRTSDDGAPARPVRARRYTKNKFDESPMEDGDS